MAFFKIVIVSIVTVFASAYEEAQDLDVDVVSLLHTSMKVTKGRARQAKRAAMQEESTDNEAEASSDYSLKNTLACSNQEVTAHEMPATAAFIEPASPAEAVQEPKSSMPEGESEDPPGASALRATLYFMITMIICDGIRRAMLEKPQKVCKERTFEEVCTEQGLDLAQAADVEEVAWAAVVKAASAGDEVNFEMAFKGDALVARTDSWGCTALHYVAAGGSAPIARDLLARGAEVDAVDANEETPFHFAARAGHVELCELLLAAGAKIDAVSAQEETPFVVAGRANQRAVCKLLADHGAGVAGMSDELLPPLVVNQLVLKVFAEIAA